VNLMRRPEVKRLVTVLMVMAMVTLMTGESGDASTPPTTGPHGAFFEKVSYFGLFRARRWMVFLTLGLLAYGLMFLYQRYSPPVRKRIRTVTATPKRLVQMRSSRFAVYAVVIVIALSIPHLVTQSYWMYLIRRTGRRLDPAGRRPQRCRGIRGIARLGLRGLLRHRRLHHGVDDRLSCRRRPSSTTRFLRCG